jgi:trehalose synthase
MPSSSLQRVPVPDRQIDAYARAAGEEAVDRIRALGDALAGSRVLHINSTPYGGGVAEHLASHIPLLRDLGVDAEWWVLDVDEEFMAVTKAMHNGLQGLDVDWNAAMERTYLDTVAAHAPTFAGDWDVVVVHDPQPAALLSFLDEVGDQHRRARWLWRCHIDLTTAQADVWEFLRPHIARHDASIWTMDQFVPGSLDGGEVRVFPPGLDPLAEKNADIPDSFLRSACRAHNIDPARPLVLQVSRFDRWKDPLGVMEAFKAVRGAVPEAQLVLVGSMAADDPEGPAYWEAANRAAAEIPDVLLLADVEDRVVNALQRSATVVVQKSIREGFGLTVAEALWKGRPVIAGRAGGITLQVRDGVDGYLVDSVDEAATRIIELLGDPARADRMGAAGRELVRERFLVTRELEDYLRAFGAGR